MRFSVFLSPSFRCLPTLAAGLLICSCALAPGQAVQAWVQRYDGATAAALVVDHDGSVIVTGNSNVGVDYITIKYSAGGVALWTNRYDGPVGGGADVPVAVVADIHGNIFVTGNSSQIPGSSSFTDIATVAYSAAGAGLWTNRYGGYVRDAATDADGNLFLAGNYGAGSTSDFLTIKYSGAGMLLWTNSYNFPVDNVDVVSAMALDADGNVYVTGYSYAGNTMTNYDYATIAYSNAGIPLWTNRYNGPYGPDLPTAIVVDCDGNVFVTGYSYNPNLRYSYETVAYSTTGSLPWANRYAGSGGTESGAQAVAVDTNGNVFVTGYSSGPSNLDYATIKYSGSGQPLWTNRFSNGLSGSLSSDEATAIAIDWEGNVLVTGSSLNASTNRDYLTVKYSGSGATLWTSRYNGPSNGNDQPSGRKCLALGLSGEVYVTGTSEGDFATVKYVSAAAFPIWLGIERAATQVVLSWTNASFSLQSAPSITGLFTNIPGASTPYTNSIVGEQMFFRLQSN